MMVIAVVIALPLSTLFTLLLLPFWRWLESNSGIESIGHSGPAGWCYLAVFLTVTAAAAWLILLRHDTNAANRGLDDQKSPPDAGS